VTQNLNNLFNALIWDGLAFIGKGVKRVNHIKERSVADIQVGDKREGKFVTASVNMKDDAARLSVVLH